MDERICDAEYFCFHDSEFIGIATFIDDPCIGDSFMKMEVHKKRGLEEIIIVPDYWVIKCHRIAKNITSHVTIGNVRNSYKNLFY